jgi:hypothetical protein
VTPLNKAVTTILEQELTVEESHGKDKRWRAGEKPDVPSGAKFGGKPLSSLRKNCLQILSTEICLSESQIVIQLLTALMYTEQVRMEKAR